MEHKQYKAGTILKRKFENFQEVVVTGQDENHVYIKDSNGVQYVSRKLLESHFELISEPGDE